MATTKCAHPACSCQVTDKNYCSDRCKAAPRMKRNASAIIQGARAITERYQIWLLGSVNIPCARARWKTRIIVGRSVREHRRVYPASVHVSILNARAIDQLGTSNGPYHSPSYSAIAYNISRPSCQSHAFHTLLPSGSNT